MDVKRDFKKGLGSGKDVTERHIQRDAKRNKDKRVKEMQRFRSSNSATTGSTHGVLLEAYQKMPLGVAPMVPSITALWTLLHQSTDDDLQKCLGVILQKTPVLSILTKTLSEPDATAGTMAAGCLEIITGARTDCALTCAHDLLARHPFLQIAHAHITSVTSIAEVLWKIIANLTCLCGEARDIILNSPILDAPFFQTIGNPKYQRIMLLIVCGMLEASEHRLPPDGFIQAVWPFLLSTLYTLAPPETPTVPVQDSDELEIALSALTYYAQHQENKALFTQLLLNPHASHVTYMVHLLARCRGGINQRRCAMYLNAVGELSNTNFMQQFTESGCIELMIRLVEHPNALLRREGIVWVGNFAAESLDCIELLIYKKAYDALSRAMRGDVKKDLIKQCIFAFCNPCITARAVALATPKEAERAYGLIAYFVNDKNIIRLTSPYVDEVGAEQTSLDILNLWKTLLVWNSEYITPKLEEVGALDKVDILWGSNFTAIYKLCEEIKQIVDPVQGDMELEESHPQVASAGFVAPGVFQGAYNF